MSTPSRLTRKGLLAVYSGPKKRKTFDKMELAAMDTVYKASKGLPTSSMIERLTSSLGLEKDQVL